MWPPPKCRVFIAFSSVFRQCLLISFVELNYQFFWPADNSFGISKSHIDTPAKLFCSFRVLSRFDRGLFPFVSCWLVNPSGWGFFFIPNSSVLCVSVCLSACVCVRLCVFFLFRLGIVRQVFQVYPHTQRYEWTVSSFACLIFLCFSRSFHSPGELLLCPALCRPCSSPCRHILFFSLHTCHFFFFKERNKLTRFFYCCACIRNVC